MTREVPSVIKAIYPDLVARLRGVEKTDPPVGSTYRRRKVRQSYFWYVQEPTRPDGHRPPERYFDRDTARVVRQIEKARGAKEQADARRLHVRALLLAGFTSPDRFAGDVVAALSEAGLFRYGGILLGPHAYLAYGPALGFRLDGLAAKAGNSLGEGQVVSIASTATAEFDILDSLHFVDKSFREIQTSSKSLAAATFVNDKKFRVEVYDAARPGNKPDGPPSEKIDDWRLFLRFLAHMPVDGALLHRSGVHVRVPSPGRYAIHKLLIATQLSGTKKIDTERDVIQASSLIEALSKSGEAKAFKTLWSKIRSKRKSWQGKLDAGSKLLPRGVAELLPPAPIAAKS